MDGEITSRERTSLISIMIAMVLIFLFLAIIDAKYCERETIIYDVIVLRLPTHHFWLWFVGPPILATVLSLMHYAGSHSIATSIGVFATFMLLSIGQLEDFFFHIFPEFPFPTVPWTECYGWTAENNMFIKVFGTWTTEMHFVWLTAFVGITIIMWLAILKKVG